MSESRLNLLTLLNKIAAEQHYKNVHINITPTTSAGANFTSKLYQIKVNGDNKTELHLFAKTAACPPKMRDQFVMNMYDTERLMYTQLVKVFRQLEDKWRISEEHKIAIPKYYGADTTYLQETIVLENLVCRGFQQHSRLESVSWPYAAAAFTELAKFHALSFAYQYYDPSGFENVVKKLKSGMLTENEGNKVFFDSCCVKALQTVRGEHKEKLQRFLNGTSLVEHFSVYRFLRHPVIIHADYRPSNILYKLRKDGSVELFIVDYQTLQVGCPVIDILYFIFSATDGPFRAKHYQQLLDHYHSELGAALARLGLDVEETYPRVDFEFELREMLSFGLKVSILVLPMLLVSEGDAPPMDEEMSMVSMAMATGDNYVKRLNEVVDECVDLGVLI